MTRDIHAYTTCFNDISLLNAAEIRTRAPILPHAVKQMP